MLPPIFGLLVIKICLIRYKNICLHEIIGGGYILH